MDQERNIVQKPDDIEDIPNRPLKDNSLDIDSSERAHMKRVYSESQRAPIDKNRTTFRKAIKHATIRVRKIL